MRCSKARMLINDHVDHLLEAKHVQELNDHLQKCPRCRELLEEMQLIVGGAKHLELALPSEDLWPAIRDKIVDKCKPAIRLPEEKSFFGFIPHPARFAYGAGIFLVAVIAVSLLYYSMPSLRTEKNDLSGTELNQIKSAQRQYEAAIQALDKAIFNQRKSPSPDLAAIFKTNLEIIDQSIHACRTAMNNDRDNKVANLHLLICYRKKMELLSEMKRYGDETG